MYFIDIEMHSFIIFLCQTGYGLFTTELFEKGAFLLEYRGKVTTAAEGRESDADENYVFYYHDRGRDMRYVILLILISWNTEKLENDFFILQTGKTQGIWEKEQISGKTQGIV